MEKGLWCYEANVAEPAHLNTDSLALLRHSGDRVITLLRSLSQTEHTGPSFKAVCNWTSRSDLQHL